MELAAAAQLDRADQAAAVLVATDVGQALAHALERGERDANLLNGLAWYTALADIYLDEALTARYLDGEPISADHLRKALRDATLRLEIVPSRSCGRRAQSAVMASTELTQRRPIAFS